MCPANFVTPSVQSSAKVQLAKRRTAPLRGIMQLTVCDLARKRLALDRFASPLGQSITWPEMVCFYWPNPPEGYVDNVRETWSGNRAKIRDRSVGAQFAQKVINRIEFQGDLKDFFALAFDRWLEQTSAEFRAVLTRAGVISNCPAIRYWPPDVIGDPLRTWREDGAIDQRHMFADREAAAHWETIRVYGTQQKGHPYKLCQDTLATTLERLTEKLSKVDEVVFLGAGSADKHFEIIDHVVTKSNNAPRFIICDGSFHMLAVEYSVIDEYLKHVEYRTQLKIELCCFDFAKSPGWSVCELGQGKKAIFILGGTIGNVREPAFFEAIKDNYTEGSILVIGASLYDDDEIKEVGREEVLKQYNENSKSIGLNAVFRPIFKSHPADGYSSHIRNVSITFEPLDGHDIPDIIKSDVPGTHGAVFRYKRPHGKIELLGEPTLDQLYLFVSRRYVASAFMAHIAERLGAAVTEIKHPKGRFSHLIVERKPLQQ